MDGGAWWAAVHGVGKSQTRLSNFTFTFHFFLHWRRKWQPTPVFLPGESQGCGAWWAAVYAVTQSQTQLKRLSSAALSTHYIFVGKGINSFGLHNRINKFPKKLNYVPVGKDGCMFAIPSLRPFLGA